MKYEYRSEYCQAMTPQEYLEEQGLSLEEFADKVQSTQPSLWRYFRGQRRIPADLAMRIEHETKGRVSVEDLVALRRPERRRKPTRRKVRQAA